MKRQLYPEAFLLRLPKGTVTKLRRSARDGEQTVSEYLRGLIRRAMDAEAGSPSNVR